jgi:membrane fusion protein
MSDLFRIQAVASQASSTGEVLRYAPPGASVLAAFFAALLVLGAGALFLIEVPDTIEVRGHVEPETGLVVLSARIAGALELGVEHGQRVEHGAVLARIQGASDKSHTDAQILEQFRRQIAALESHAEQIGRHAAGTERVIMAELSELEASRGILESEIVMQRQLIDIAQARVGQADALQRSGSGSLAQVQERRLLLIEAEMALVRLRGQQGVLDSRIEAAQGRLALNAVERDRDLAALSARLSALSIEALQIESETVQTLAAPRAGRIGAIHAAGGSSVESGRAVLTLVPDEAHLIARAWLPASAFGSVQPGDPIIVRFDAGRAADRRQLHGSIRSISPSPAVPLAQGAAAPGEPVHLLEIDIGPEAPRWAEGLRSGVTFSARVIRRQEALWRALWGGR